MSTDRWIYKQNTGHTYNGFLFTIKKEGSAHAMCGWTLKTLD